MKFVADRHFDLVLTDLKMTGMSGLDLLKRAHRFLTSRSSLFCSLLTARSTRRSMQPCLDAFEYLSKTLRQREAAREPSRGSAQTN